MSGQEISAHSDCGRPVSVLAQTRVSSRLLSRRTVWTQSLDTLDSFYAHTGVRDGAAGNRSCCRDVWHQTALKKIQKSSAELQRLTGTDVRWRKTVSFKMRVNLLKVSSWLCFSICGACNTGCTWAASTVGKENPIPVKIEVRPDFTERLDVELMDRKC